MRSRFSERSPEDARLLLDVSPGRWLEEWLPSWENRPEDGVRLGLILPEGFSGYARIFHPAEMRGLNAPISWSNVAARMGKVVHPLMQFGRLLGSDDPYANLEWVSPPRRGELPEKEGSVLIEILRGFTSTLGLCYFCIWEGDGFLDPDLYVGVPRVELPWRKCLLFVAPLEGVMAFMDETNFWPTPTLWWPADRSWCVSTDIDLLDTYVGGSEECISRILDDPRLEALPASIEDRIDFGADTINV